MCSFGASAAAAENHSSGGGKEEREIFIENPLVRVHLIIEIILVDRHCATGV